MKRVLFFFFPICFFLSFCSVIFRTPFVQKTDTWNQKNPTDQRAYTGKCKGPDIIHPHALCYKSCSPNKCRQKDIYYKITVPEVEKLRKERNFPKEFDEIIGYGLQASKNGVNRVHILDGRIRHVLLIEFFSVNGAGTIFIETEAKLYLHELGK